mgnify:FL=1
MKKKILFTAYSLDIGGIESALVNMLKILDYSKYDVTLLLEKKEGIFLDEIPKEVTIEEYRISDNKNAIIRKIRNRLKLIKWIIKNHNKYDFAGCFATYSIPGTILSRYASGHNALWIHSNYYYVYHKNTDKMKRFFEERKVEKFENLVFVSNEAKSDFFQVLPDVEVNSIVLNNILDDKKIIEKSNESIKKDNLIKEDTTIFTFVGRLEEESKRLTRLFESFKLFLEKNDAILWIIGDGPSKNEYENKVKELNISQNVIFLGRKKNPYPYIKASNLIVLTSDYEGFPVVCVESMILKKPFLSTIDISDPYIKLSDYGKIVDKDVIEIKNELEHFVHGENFIKEKFNYSKYQKKLEKDLISLIEGK